MYPYYESRRLSFSVRRCGLCVILDNTLLVLYLRTTISNGHPFFLFFAVDWNLQIDPVSIEDDGRYQCQMTPLRSRYAYLNVWKTPEDPFVENGPIIKVKESVEVKLTCVARNGKPPAKVSAAKALKKYNDDDFCCYSRTRNHKSF